MKKYLLIIFSAVFFSFLYFSCKKEQMPASAITVNQLAIATDTTAYTAVQFSNLKISPTITESKPQGHAYSYKWTVWTQMDTTLITISHQQALDTVVSVVPGIYYLQYTVTDQTTGISYFKLVNLTVQGSFSEGWLVSNNKAGKGYLSVIRADDSVFYSPFEDANHQTFDGSAIAAYTSVTSFFGVNEITYITDKGLFTFDPNTFEITGTNSTLLSSPTSFGASAYQAYDGYYLEQFLFNGKGDVMGGSSDNFAGAAAFSERLSGDYYAFPFLFNLGAGYVHVFYDNKNKRFMTSALLSHDVSATSGKGTNFTMNNVGKTMIAADNAVGGEYYCVMSDDAGYYLYSVKTASPYAAIAQPMLNCPDIASATSFATSSLVRLLYYAAGNKIYVYDVLANTARLVYTFPSNYKISCMKMFKPPYRAVQTAPADDLFNLRLVVGTDNGSGTSTNGEIYYLDLSQVGDVLNNTYSKVFKGFGQIAHLNYRNSQ